MAAGDLKRPTRRQHAALDAAVARAEEETGLQFGVFLGTVDDADPRAHAHELFHRAGMHEGPGVLVVVAPKQRRIEIVTSELARGRIADADAAAAIEQMTASFRRGELTAGLIAGLEHLATAAGPAVSEATQPRP